MPDPISTRVDEYSRARNYSGDDDLTCRDEPLASLAASHPDASSSSTAADGAPAIRTEPGVRGPHAEAHADGDLYAGAFALKGRTANGIDVEVFSASAHAGEREAVAQVGMARLGGTMSGGHVSVSGEVFTAQTHAGCDNPDGSVGLGTSAGWTVAGGEITVRSEADSASFGASIGTTMGASYGVRDIDRDGQPEYCGRLDFGVASVGLCIEKRW